MEALFEYDRFFDAFAKVCDTYTKKGEDIVLSEDESKVLMKKVLRHLREEEEQERLEGQQREAELRKKALRETFEEAKRLVNKEQQRLAVLREECEKAETDFKEARKEAASAEFALGECYQICDLVLREKALRSAYKEAANEVSHIEGEIAALREHHEKVRKASGDAELALDGTASRRSAYEKAAHLVSHIQGEITAHLALLKEACKKSAAAEMALGEFLQVQEPKPAKRKKARRNRHRHRHRHKKE